MIKRYALNETMGETKQIIAHGLSPHHEGPLVLFIDHEAAVQKLRDKITITIVNFEERRAKYEAAVPVSEPKETPYAVICSQHNRQFLTEKQYDDQMWLADSPWRCPVCRRSAEWDDDWYEEHILDQPAEAEHD